MNTKVDTTVMDELFKVYAMPVQSDFELAMKQELNAWVKNHPAHKSWATPAESAKEFWAERLK
jgi:hypothetical protein